MLKNLQYISDIHLEYRTKVPYLKPISNHLALLGDIGNPFKNNYKEFLIHTSKNWDKVFLIAGNHEYYHNKDNVDDKIKDIISSFNNVYYLNNDKYEFLNYTILGTTLWSKLIKPINYKNVTMEEMNHKHEECCKYLKNNIVKNTIVLSHYLPSYKLIIDKYKHCNNNDRYASNIDFLHLPIKYWLCGHSHCIIEMNINGVMCCINAIGHDGDMSLKFISVE